MGKVSKLMKGKEINCFGVLLFVVLSTGKLQIMCRN